MVGWARIFRRQIAGHGRLPGALATIVVEQFHGLAQESAGDLVRLEAPAYGFRGKIATLVQFCLLRLVSGKCDKGTP